MAKKKGITRLQPGFVTESQVIERWQNVRESAKQRGIHFDMSLNKVKTLLKRKTCAYTGVTFSVDNSEPHNQMTFDRIDAEKGYIDSNVVVCTHRINTLKGNLSKKEIVKMYQAILKVK